MFLVLLSLTLAAHAAPVTGTGSASESGLAAKGSVLNIRNPHGPVRVVCTKSATTASASTTWSLEGAEAKAIAADIQTTVAKTAKGADLAVAAPKTFDSLDKKSLELVVNVPANGAFTVQAGAGDVKVEGCEGTIEARNDTGNVTLSGAFEGVQAVAPKGDIDLSISEGTLRTDSRIEAATGNIVMSMPGVTAGLDVRASNIDVSNIVMSMPGFTATQQSTTRLVGKVGTDGAQMAVLANKGKVTFRK